MDTNPKRRLSVRLESWPVAGEFRISRGAVKEVEVVVAEISVGDVIGRGEARPYSRFGETSESVLRQMDLSRPEIEGGMKRSELAESLPPGAARNALDCALWDLESRLRGEPVWRFAGLARPGPLTTAYTLSLGTPEAMGHAAEKNSDKALLKLKLDGGEDLERVGAVRDAAPGARIIIDANEAWTADRYDQLVPGMAELGVELIEQPLREGHDEALADLPRPVKVCADESCHDRPSLEGLVGRYDVINIKLDKAGGLTEALALRRTAEGLGFGIMVGMMVATSLAVAPASLVAQGVPFVDLDGPLLLARDREGGARYEGSTLQGFAGELWGGV